jgi:phage gp36-like protein
MSWISLTATDVRDNLNDAEYEEYRRHVGPDQADPMASILADVTAEVRGYVSTEHEISGTTGIPQSLKNAAIDIAIYRLAKRCHMGTEQQRKPAADAAVTLLQRVAEGDHGVDDTTIKPVSSGAAWGSREKII